MSPHSKPKGLSELTQPDRRGKEGLRAGGSPGPELPKSRGTLEGRLGKRKIHKKYLSREKACYSHDGTDGSANIDLIRIAASSAQRLEEVIWKATRGC